MKRRLGPLLQLVVVLLGIATLVLMLWEPQLEGRNVNATIFQIYFQDPFLAYAYLSSLLFFVALYQAFKLFGYMGLNKTKSTLKALRTIKYCLVALVASVAGAEAYLFIFQRGKEDIAGGVAVGLLLIFVFAVIAAALGVFERKISSD